MGATKRICESEAFRWKTGAIYRKRKIDVEPVFGFLKANLRFTRFSVRGKSKVENEMGLALMAVNLRKFTAINKNYKVYYKKIEKSVMETNSTSLFSLFEASYVPASWLQRK